ncbi:MAG: T9SS type A sorting domain-containing protein [Bacteroidetes bacterium]|nr:T9SS type A sorting domain-containing protein [Bacteroidota bacterium]MDQ3192090.1 T9SS type A sorting domain-containing protein [Bacteroidota bacterium]HET6243580.1 T9SS type A sorting domain-containing protein [Bacteroidia bacterium]
MRKKTTIVVLLFLSVFAVKSQTYTIPGATKQPAWTFPIWMEDGSGQKDSVYIGYDPNSSGHFGGNFWMAPPYNEGAADTSFGEKWVKRGSGFYIELLENPTLDSISKVIVTQWNFLNLNIRLNNGIWPITIKYDVGLFYADTLPFTDTIKPEAYAEFYCSDVWPDSDFNCFTNGPTYYLTDSTHYYFGSNWRVMPGGFVLTGDNTTTSPNGMGIDIIFKDFYSFFNQVKVKENIGNNSLKVFPNPANNNITIEGATEGPYNVAILDYSGRTVFSKNNLPNKSSIPVFYLEAGLYFIKVSTSESVNLIKLIKQ